MKTLTQGNVQVGVTYEWHPTAMKGRDGKVYNVYVTHAGGWGWSAKQYHVAAIPNPEVFLVRVLPPHEWNTKENTIHVALVRGNTVPMFRFARRPYVRKDGMFTVLSDDWLAGTPIGGACGKGFGSSYSFAVNSTGDIHVQQGQLIEVA